MINIKKLRDEIDTVQSALASRCYELDKDTFIKLEKERKILQVDVESLQSERKNLSNEFGKLKSQGEDTDKLKIKIDQINNDLKEKDTTLQVILEKINIFLLDIPNVPHDSTPIGLNEDDNVVVKRYGDNLSTNTVDHLDITSKIDTEINHKDDKKVGMIATRNEMFGAVYNPVTVLAVITPGSAIHAAHIGTGIGFGHGERINPFTTHSG